MFTVNRFDKKHKPFSEVVTYAKTKIERSEKS